MMNKGIKEYVSRVVQCLKGKVISQYKYDNKMWEQ